MKKLITFWVVMGSICSGMGEKAATPVQPAQPEAACTALPASVVPAAWILESLSPASASAMLMIRPRAASFGMSELEDCPQETACPALILLDGTCVAGCRIAGSPQTTDTGNDECQQGSEVFSCPEGQTIHITTQSCGPCKCCTRNPPCFCPQNCAAFSALTDWGCQ